MRTSLLTIRASSSQRDVTHIVKGSTRHIHTSKESSVFQPGLLQVQDCVHSQASEESSLSELLLLAIGSAAHSHIADNVSTALGDLADDFSVDTRSQYTIYEAVSGATWSHDLANGWVEIAAAAFSDYLVFGRNLDLRSVGYFKAILTITNIYNPYSTPHMFMTIENADSSRQYDFRFTAVDPNGDDIWQGGDVIENGEYLYQFREAGVLNEENVEYIVEGFWGPDTFSMDINGVKRFITAPGTEWNDLSRFKFEIKRQDVNLTYLYVGAADSTQLGSLIVEKSTQAIKSDAVQLTTYGGVIVEPAKHLHFSDEASLTGVKVNDARHQHAATRAIVTYSVTGSGTAEDPYLIYSPGDLEYAEVKPTAHFRLERDIVMTEAWTPFWFRGVMDGNRHTINVVGLTFERPEGYSGFFRINEGDISNLGIIGGTFKSSSEDDYVGSIAGQNRGTITQCFARDGKVVVPNDKYGGGLVGHNSGDISECYSAQEQIWTGELGSSAGGIATFNTGTGVRNYFDSDKWGSTNLGEGYTLLGVPKSTAEMQTASTFVDWDPEIWILEDGSYPRFVTIVAQSAISYHQSDSPGLVTFTTVIASSSSHLVTSSKAAVAPDGVFTVQPDKNKHVHTAEQVLLGYPFELVSTAGGDGSAVTYPAGIQGGDIILLFCSTHNTTTYGPTGSGWTNIYDIDMSGTDYAACWWRSAAGGESGTSFSTHASSSLEYFVVVLRGCGAPITSASSPTGTLDTPSIAVEENNRLLGVVHGWYSGNTDLAAPTFYDVFEVERWSGNEGVIVAGTTVDADGTDPGHTFTDSGGATYNKPFAVTFEAFNVFMPVLATAYPSVHAHNSGETDLKLTLDIQDAQHSHTSDTVTVT